MKPKTETSFKAVDFMRQMRNELSDLYHVDKERYHNELKKSMEEFLSTRLKPTPNIVLPEVEPTNKS